MKIKNITVVALSVLGVFGAVAKTERPEQLKVLMIGNSFSICNLRQMPQIADSMGLKLDITSLYIGGCSLERHWTNVVKRAADEKFSPYKVTWNYASLGDQSKVPFASVLSERTNRHGYKEKCANIPQVLAADKWDIVTIQQASHFSWDPKTYHPFGDNLVAEIKRLAPQAKIVVQETWSYPPWDKRLKKFGFDQVDMYAKLHDAYAAFAAKYGFEVIPVGTAAEFCPDRNRLFTKPDFHYNREGEYLQGLVWTAKLFGADVTKCAYRPDWLDAARADELKRCAMDALAPARVRRAFRDARVTRGNTNILRIQPIDSAAWLWLPGDSGTDRLGERELGAHPGGSANVDPIFLKFRNEFTVEKGDGTLVLDVSAD